MGMKNIEHIDPERVTVKWQMPILRAENHVPEHLINFNEAVSSKDYSAGVHFFIDDYRFERIWNCPLKYIEMLKKFDCVFTPDFSLYMDMLKPQKIDNIFRSRLIGQMCQDAGIKVIPTVSWAEPKSYDYCFEGLPVGGVVAVSTVGVAKYPDARKVFADGMAVMIERLKPCMILMYGKAMPETCGNVPFKSFPNTAQIRMATNCKKRG